MYVKAYKLSEMHSSLLIKNEYLIDFPYSLTSRERE